MIFFEKMKEFLTSASIDESNISEIKNWLYLVASLKSQR